ncbi:hypothetical protein JMY81_23570 [Brenneria goodwinii]|uniref:hypothetical protein n=1 Tax=Brenneria goodwinii TaxID=1109412 RepID=UPI0011C42C29|nr:hypothetical protein [Brenneria goodwinii]MCG8159133.1 hypothetical protein [Brenneria goodwinii]MCG8163768.1 hypothetical protein [Brenneria goodwinii]MCG8168363.1 hypothetical protein [Brenneria goodwinii]MCG8172999.1 hypothetical protein [Brenneria goodwinii]MCG8177643.1 hypothetical protein [Brenneria goodwinii]
MKLINWLWLMLFDITPLAAIRPFKIVRKRKAFAQKLDSTSTLGDKSGIEKIEPLTTTKVRMPPYSILPDSS